MKETKKDLLMRYVVGCKPQVNPPREEFVNEVSVMRLSGCDRQTKK